MTASGNGHGNGHGHGHAHHHRCDGPWQVDSAPLQASGGSLRRLVCTHGWEIYQSVAGDDTVEEYIPGRLTIEVEVAVPVPPPRRPVTLPPPEACWFCAQSTHKPCSRHGGLDPIRRNMLAAKESYQRKRAARPARTKAEKAARAGRRGRGMALFGRLGRRAS
jgi:hypothetical protein